MDSSVFATVNRTLDFAPREGAHSGRGLDALRSLIEMCFFSGARERVERRLNVPMGLRGYHERVSGCKVCVCAVVLLLLR